MTVAVASCQPAVPASVTPHDSESESESGVGARGRGCAPLGLRRSTRSPSPPSLTARRPGLRPQPLARCLERSSCASWLSFPPLLPLRAARADEIERANTSLPLRPLVLAPRVTCALCAALCPVLDAPVARAARLTTVTAGASLPSGPCGFSSLASRPSKLAGVRKWPRRA